MQLKMTAFRITAILEGLSFLVLLLIAMPLKYIYDLPQMVQIVGMLHGILFIAYVLGVWFIKPLLNWSSKVTFMALLASVLPFGTFYIDAKYLRASK